LEEEEGEEEAEKRKEKKEVMVISGEQDFREDEIEQDQS
jgi:hypothetical protein